MSGLAEILIDKGFTVSGSDTKASYETLMGDTSNADIKWIYAQDDELAMGIMEALNGGGISDSTKEAIYAAKPFITGCGGLGEYYDVIGGESYADITEKSWRRNVCNIQPVHDPDSDPGYGGLSGWQRCGAGSCDRL